MPPGFVDFGGLDEADRLLLADAQTTGGYTKIACVIGADLSRLAGCIPGDRLRFAAVSVEEAEAAARDHDDRLHRIADSIVPVAGGFDERALYRCNLIGGVVDMDNADHFPGHLADPE